MKQETLEETTRNYSEKEYSTPIPLGICSDFARLGAKWQEERSYSEEQVREIALEYRNTCMHGHSHKLTRFELQDELRKIDEKHGLNYKEGVDYNFD